MLSIELQDFVRYVQDHIRGDEKSEAQSFLNRWFRAFGHEGAIEAGAELESRLKKGSAKGNTGFADLVWRSRPGVPGVVIEMKSRGEDLNKHYVCSVGALLDADYAESSALCDAVQF
jgi:hypothetical protein